MSASDRLRPAPCRRTQGGAVAVEFALLALVFFTLVIGVIEVSRLLYILNTLQEVTRRAAAAAVHVYPSDAAALDRVRQDAVFRTTPGTLLFGEPVTDQHVRISYLKFDFSEIPAASWPASAAANRQVCMANPHADNCIRFVRAQVCDTAETDTCRAVTAQTLVSLLNLRIPLHRATTVAIAESLGYVPGTAP